MFSKSQFLAVVRCALIVCAVAGMFAGGAASAQAQELGGNQVDADFEGKVGGGLLGAELGLVAVGLFEVEETWPYLLAAGVGAAGGSVLGHFLVDNNNAVELGVGMMAAGMALAVPAIVFAAAASAYDPRDEAATQPLVASGPAFRRAAAGPLASRSTRPSQPVRAEQAALLRWDGSRASLGAPAVAIVPAFSLEERLQYGVGAMPELRLGLAAGRF